MPAEKRQWAERVVRWVHRPVSDALFRPGGVQRKCMRAGCGDDAAHFSPVCIEPRTPPGWCERTELGWAFLCGRHFDAFLDREWED